MYYISRELLYLIRAILFGFAVGYAIFSFFYYFKPFAENTFNIKNIDTDVWWWSGVAISVVLGVAAFLSLM